MGDRDDRRQRRRQELLQHGADLLAGLSGHPLRLSTNGNDGVTVWDGDTEVASCPKCSRAAVVTRPVGEFLADGPATLELALQIAAAEAPTIGPAALGPCNMTGPSALERRDAIAEIVALHRLIVEGEAARCSDPVCSWTVGVHEHGAAPEWLHAQHVADRLSS